MTKKLIFTGCSFTAGNGWVNDDYGTADKQHPNLWTNLCHQNIHKISDLEQLNYGVGGASNHDIFVQATSALSKFGRDIDTIFCQWTAMPRYSFNVGFEMWDTTEQIIRNNRRTHDHRLNRGDKWSREYVNDLLDRLKVLHHLHWEILHVVRYTNIIKNLASNLQIQNVFFINGLCPWDENYFIYLKNVLPESYTPFTKADILNIDSRDDNDIYALYARAHSQYQEAGGIDPENWVNLYGSFLDRKIDFNFDLYHPGKQSNLLYYNLIKEKLSQAH